MEGRKVWEYYLIIPSDDITTFRDEYPFTDFILGDDQPATVMGDYVFDDLSTIIYKRDSVIYTDYGYLILYAIAINKKSKKIFEKERDMSKFICKEFLLADEFEYADYCDANSLNILDVVSEYESDPLITRSESSEVDKSKYTRILCSFTRGERMILTKIQIMEDDPITVRIMTKCMSILSNKNMLERISKVIVSLAVQDIFELDDFKKGIRESLRFLRVDRIMNYIYYSIGASGVLSDDTSIKELSVEEDVTMDELLLAVYLFGNTLKK